jgi:hypothetical protein
MEGQGGSGGARRHFGLASRRRRVVDVVRAAKGGRGPGSLTLGEGWRGRARAGEGWRGLAREGVWSDGRGLCFVFATCVQALMSARGSVERSAPPVRVHNLSKIWLRRLPGAAAGAAPGPLDRLQGQGVSRGGFQGCGEKRAIHGSDEIRTEGP